MGCLNTQKALQGVTHYNVPMENCPWRDSALSQETVMARFLLFLDITIWVIIQVWNRYNRTGPAVIFQWA